MSAFLCVCVHVHVYAKVSHLSAATSQDASSFGWHVYMCMLFCPTFQSMYISAVCRRTCVCRQVLVQVPHRLVGVCVCVCTIMCVYMCIFEGIGQMPCLYVCFLVSDSISMTCVYYVCTVCKGFCFYIIYAIEAVHRFYESRRRLFNDDQPSRRDKADELKKKCKTIGYQKKVMCFCITKLI